MNLTYTSARAQIQSGDLIALKHKRWRTFYDWQVQAVQTVTQSPYCHVAQVWAVGERLFVLEAVTPLVRMVPLTYFAMEGFYWIQIGTPMNDVELAKALEQVAIAGYSKWQALLAFFGRLELGADQVTQCCEYVITNRRLSGVDLGPVATPAAVVQAALAQGKPLFYVQGK